MPQGSSLDIPLEHLSEKLKLSRRRLYDIINIMESLQMAVKVNIQCNLTKKYITNFKIDI
jgi:hypothetical protein